jgi:hypothetical protein
VKSDPLVITTDSPIAPLALRPRDCARAIGISERLLFTWTRETDIPHLRIGSTVLYPVDSLREWLARSATPKSERGPATT